VALAGEEVGVREFPPVRAHLAEPLHSIILITSRAHEQRKNN
jgi:hypothetical protein